MLASNVEITWTSKDGGVDRSYTSMPFPITFKKKADPAKNIRAGDPRLKDPAYAQKLAPQLWYLLMAVFRVFMKPGVNDTIVLPRPLAVATVTAQQLLDHMQEQLHTFMSERIRATTDRRRATKSNLILRAFALYIRNVRGVDESIPLDKKEIQDADLLLPRRTTQITASRGVNNIMGYKNTTGKWLVLKDGDADTDENAA